MAVLLLRCVVVILTPLGIAFAEVATTPPVAWTTPCNMRFYNLSWLYNTSAKQWHPTHRVCPSAIEMSQDEAVSCLRGRHVLFIGDSISRYQYLNFVDALENGWGNASGGRGGEPSMANEKQWGGWMPFFVGTNRRLNGKEICDCHREPLKIPTAIENRYYYDGHRKLWVSYLKVFGLRNPFVHHTRYSALNVPCITGELEAFRRGKSMTSATCPQKGCGPGSCNRLPGIAYSGAVLKQVLRAIERLQPSDVIFNVGFWGATKTTPGLINNLLKFGQGVRGVPSVRRLYFKTTTPMAPGKEAQDIKPNKLAHALALDNWRIWDTYGAVNKLRKVYSKMRVELPTVESPFWDSKHLTDSANTGLSRLLVAELCSA